MDGCCSQEDCSESEIEPGSFLVEYDLPKISGKIALKIMPRGRHDATYSVLIDYGECTVTL